MMFSVKREREPESCSAMCLTSAFSMLLYTGRLELVPIINDGGEQ